MSFRFGGEVQRVSRERLSPFAGLSRLFWSFLCVTLLTWSLNTTSAQVPAGAHRPSTVPEEFLRTPFGYFHPSCVKHLLEGDILRPDEGAIQHKDGSLDSMAVCGYPHYNPKGQAIPNTKEQRKSPSISHAWVEDYGAETSSSFGELKGNWTIPPSPTSHDDQTLYFFPGLMDYNDDIGIIQPVLGWNADFSNAWGIASWDYVEDPYGTTYESPAVSTNSGDTIAGTIQSACGAGTVTCGSWNITTQDVSSGHSTTASQVSNWGQTFNWAVGGVLEVYSIEQCSDYPTNGSISFYNLALYDNSFNQISNPGWIINDAGSASYSGLTPQCNYGGQETASQVTLQYGQPQTAEPSESNFVITLNGTPPSSISYSFVLNDSTPGATIHYQLTICNSPYAYETVSPGTEIYVTNSCPDTQPYGTMYATAPGYSQSVSTSLTL